MRQVTIKVRHHGEPESDVSADYPGLTLRSISSLTGRTTERKRIIEVSGDPEVIPSFIEDFRSTDSIVEAEPISPLGEPRVYVAMTFNAYVWDSIAERLTDMGIHYKTGTEISGGWEHWTLYLEEDDDVSEIVETLRAGGNDANLVREVDMSGLEPQPQLDTTQFTEELTPRQREVLATAVDRGYYGVDGEIDIDDLASADESHVSTVWEHLSRAEEKVMASVGELLDVRPPDGRPRE